MLICSSHLVYVLHREYSTISLKHCTGYWKLNMAGMSLITSTTSSLSSHRIVIYHYLRYNLIKLSLPLVSRRQHRKMPAAVSSLISASNSTLQICKLRCQRTKRLVPSRQFILSWQNQRRHERFSKKSLASYLIAVKLSHLVVLSSAIYSPCWVVQNYALPVPVALHCLVQLKLTYDGGKHSLPLGPLFPSSNSPAQITMLLPTLVVPRELGAYIMVVYSPREYHRIIRKSISTGRRCMLFCMRLYSGTKLGPLVESVLLAITLPLSMVSAKSQFLDLLSVRCRQSSSSPQFSILTLSHSGFPQKRTSLQTRHLDMTSRNLLTWGFRIKYLHCAITIPPWE